MEAYHHVLPKSRLGIGHYSLASYVDAVNNNDSQKQQQQHNKDVPIEFSLIVVLSRDAHLHHDNDNASDSIDDDDENVDRNISILLGKKLRGFGKGFFNSLGGKLEKGEHDNPTLGAARELEEESGIKIPLSVMQDGFVGVINFTFEDDDINRAMRVHLFSVFVSLSNNDDARSSHDNAAAAAADNNGVQPTTRQYAHTTTIIHPNQIRGCDEIEPEWFHNIHDIPLNQMFADDSLWLTMLLSHYNVCEKSDSAPQKLMFDAWFHFRAGGTKTNSIMHHYIHVNAGSETIAAVTAKSPQQKVTLEKRLFHELHLNHIHSPSIKEFKENWTMANAVRTFMRDEKRMEYIVDVAGGHGALAALFLVLIQKCHTAVVIDPALCSSGKHGVREAWSKFWNNGFQKKELRYRHECLRTGLRGELDSILKKTKCTTNVTVVACHACQHLTDEILQIASEYGVNVAVLPCCQKDHDGWWKGLTKRLVDTRGNKNNASSLNIGTIMDLLAAGKMMGWDTGLRAGVWYQVKMKLMDESISLQNRMILCKAMSRGDGDKDEKKEMAHRKLMRAYHRAHQLKDSRKMIMASDWCSSSLLVGFCLGSVLSFLIASRIQKN